MPSSQSREVLSGCVLEQLRFLTRLTRRVAAAARDLQTLAGCILHVDGRRREMSGMSDRMIQYKHLLTSREMQLLSPLSCLEGL